MCGGESERGAVCRPNRVPCTGHNYSVARWLAAYRTDLEAGENDALVSVPDQLGAGSGRDTVRAFRGTVLYAVDFQKVVPALVVLDVERRHVKLEWHTLLDDAVLVVGVLLAGAEVVGVHAPVVVDRARSGDNLEAVDGNSGDNLEPGGLSCSGLEERAQGHGP